MNPPQKPPGAPLSLVLAGATAYAITVCGLLGNLRLGLIIFFLPHLFFLGRGALLAVVDFVAAQEKPAPRVMAYMALGVVLLFLFAQASLPITARDALIYHLYVPKLWLELNSIHEISWHEWSYFPLQESTVYAGFIWLGVPRLACCAHLLFFLVAAGMSQELAQSLGVQKRFAALAFILTLTLPTFARAATEPIADLVVAAYFGGALVSTLRCREEPGWPHIAIAGACLGCALSAKYTGLLALLLMVPLSARWFHLMGQNSKRIFRQLGLLLGVAGVVSAPWWLRNTIWVGNPFFPLFGSIMGDDGESAYLGGIPPLMYRHLVYDESWLEIALIPLRILFGGADGSTRTFDGKLSPVLILPFLLLIRRRGEAVDPFAHGLLLFIAAHLLLPPALFHFVSRYHAAVVVPWCALVAMSLARVGAGRSGKSIVGVVLVVHLGWFCAYGAGLLSRSDTVRYLTTSMSDEQYLSSQLDEYRLARFAAHTFPREARLQLLFTGNKYWLYDQEVRGSYFSTEQWRRTLPKPGGAQQLCAQLRAQSISHLVFHGRRWSSFVENQERESPQFADELRLFLQQCVASKLTFEGYEIATLKTS